MRSQNNANNSRSLARNTPLIAPSKMSICAVYSRRRDARNAKSALNVATCSSTTIQYEIGLNPKWNAASNGRASQCSESSPACGLNSVNAQARAATPTPTHFAIVSALLGKA